jgi:predicted nicotinamide N-methyase
LVPEVRLHLASELIPLWQATEWQEASPRPPPFWAFAWPGSQALARYILDGQSDVHGKSVLDVGAGSGLAAIAAALAGARGVVACDMDPIAASVQQRNARLNGVSIETLSGDVVTLDPKADIVLAGDVFYEREAAERIIAWLHHQVTQGRQALLADPGRHYAPQDGLELLQTYDVPTLEELESVRCKRTRLWKVV